MLQSDLIGTLTDCSEPPIDDYGLAELREALPKILTTASITKCMRDLSGDGSFSISEKETRKAIATGKLVAYSISGKFIILRAHFIDFLCQYRFMPVNTGVTASKDSSYVTDISNYTEMDEIFKKRKRK